VLLSALDDAMNYAERAPNEYKRCCCGIKPFLHHPRSLARVRMRAHDKHQLTALCPTRKRINYFGANCKRVKTN